MAQLEEIKARIDIVDLVSETVKLRRAGRNFSGLCPFHSEKTPSFIVSPERGAWRCFGQCNEGGDIFSFVMKKEGWDFKETLRFLAQKAGVTLEAYTPRQQEAKDANERLRGLLEEAVNFYRHQLLQTDAGKGALDYLHEKRGLTGATVETFGLGYAPDAWESARTHFIDKGYAESELLEAGLLSSRDSGGTYDRFRNRIMIPIRDEQGRMAGFGARIMPPHSPPLPSEMGGDKGGAKFLNSPETPLFSKSRLLYGLDRARKPIRIAGQAVIVEGYLDVIALHQAGFENVVSPMGTALTEEQLRLLKRSTRRIVLALDPDAAGQKAVLHGLDAARQALDRQTETGFDARGLLRHEARLQADLRVASMPDNLDPDEIVQRDPDEWKRLVSEAQPVVLHVMNTLAAGRDLEDARVKSEIAAQVLPLIEDLPNPVERDTYRQRLARFLKVDERALLGPQAAGGKGRRIRPRPEKPAQAQGEAPAVEARPLSPGHSIESHILSILLAKPGLLYRHDRALQEAGLARLGAEDFGYTDHQIIFRMVRQALEQEGASPEEDLRRELPLAGLAADLLTQAAQWQQRDDTLLDDLLRATVKLRRMGLGDSINQLRYLQEEANQQGDLMAGSYREMVLQQSRLLRHLDQAGSKLGAARRQD
ncbi:MAG: DNA primase [Chloroflexi bacterium]|nr:DNA primase [Chloroflexota bacterium]